MVDMTSISSEKGLPLSAHISDFLMAVGRFISTADRPYRASLPIATASRGFVRRKYLGAALLVLCAVYAGGLLSLYTPFVYSGVAGRLTVENYRDLLATPVAQSEIPLHPLIQVGFAATPEIQPITVDLPKIGLESKAEDFLFKTGRALGTAALRKATDRLLGLNAHAALPVSQTEPDIQGISRSAAPQVMVAMYLKTPKGISLANGKPKSFGESQRLIDMKDISNPAFAKNHSESCGGFAAGRQSSDFAHGVKGASSGFGHRSSGFSVPELNWKWCAL